MIQNSIKTSDSLRLRTLIDSIKDIQKSLHREYYSVGKRTRSMSDSSGELKMEMHKMQLERDELRAKGVIPSPRVKEKIATL